MFFPGEICLFIYFSAVLLSLKGVYRIIQIYLANVRKWMFFFQCFSFSSFAVFYLWFSASLLLFFFFFFATKAFCLYSHIKSLVVIKSHVGETWPQPLKEAIMIRESVGFCLCHLCGNCLLLLTYSDTLSSQMMQMHVSTCQWACQDSWPLQIWYWVF